MKFKREIIAIILIISMLFTISAISAADSSTDAVSVTNADVEAVSEDVADNNLTMKNDVEILGETDGGTFADLNSKITGASGTVTLENDYEYSSTDSGTGGIVISSAITIDGNNKIIDAKGASRIFDVQSNNVVIKNVVFKNGYSANYGGAIYASTNYQSNYISIINCTFVNNFANEGGAIYSNAYYDLGSIENSTFINNRANGKGAAIYNYADAAIIDGCILVGNTASNSIIYTYSAITVTNSILVNNQAPTIFAANSPSITANKNWWGTTSDNLQNLPTLGSGVTVDNYYVLDMTLDDQGIATVSLNNLYQNGGVAQDSDYALPSIKLNVTGINVEVRNNIVLGSTGVATIEYTPADAYAITVSYNGAELTREVKPTFKLLNDLINADGSEITLEQDYIYDSSKDSSLTNGVEFAKDMTIDGQGHIIDAKQSNNIFYFNDETNLYSLTLKNIIFTNAVGINGAAVYFKGKKIEIINCTFINNAANSQGDAVYVADASSSENKIVESRFINNTGSDSVVYVNLESLNSKLNLNNSIFVRNGATYNVKGTSNVIADYNWWGNTAEDYATNSPNVDGVTLNNWLFLKIDANAAITDDATVSLNNLFDGDDVATYSEYSLPSITLNLKGSGVNIKVNTITLDENGEANYEVTMLKKSALITANYEDITTTKQLEYTIVDDGSFKALNDILWFAEGDIELTKNYTFIEGVDTITDGMSIIRGITVNGNGYTIDAKGKAAILIVRAHNVQLKNINFVNGVAEYGGAIGTGANYLSIDNCTFINNTANEDGGAIYAQSYYSISVKNSKFINNTANEDGGAIFTYAYYSPYAVVDGCIFINNTALYSSVMYAYVCNVQNSIFLNNPGNMIRGYYSNYHVIQNNWFGNTIDNRANKPDLESPISSWLYLDIKFYEEFAIISLNNLYASSSSSSSVISDYDLPEITLNLNSTNLNLNTDKVTLDSAGKAIVPYTKIADDAKLTVSNDYVSLTKDALVGDFDVLQYLVDEASANDVIELTRDYNYVEGVDTITNGISITKDITIDGKGHTIDAKGLSRVFNINDVSNSLNFVFKNINFVNGNSINGGAVYFKGNTIEFENCTFKNNVVTFDGTSSTGFGGALYLDNYGSKFINCTFIENSLKSSNKKGGAVYIYDKGGLNNFTNCIFVNNTATLYGGGIATDYGYSTTSINKCIFITNKATANHFGCAVYCKGGSSAELYINNSLLFNSIITSTDNLIYVGSNLKKGDVNNNWWMHTADNKAQSAYVRCSGGGLTVNKWLFLDMDCESDIATVSINNVYDKSSQTSSKYDGELPQITFDISGTNVVVDDTATLNRNGVAEAAYDMTAQTGSLTATYNNVSITKQLTVDDSFTALQGKISRAMEGSELLLYHDYNYDSTKDSSLTEGIVIDRDLTIDGQGFTVDAKNTARIFKIEDNTKNIVLKNINFVNAAGADGAAVYANCNNIEIINCTFENNEATGNGDALYVVANSCDIIGSTFVNNVGSVSTIYLDCESDEATFNIYNSILVNNGGAGVVKVKGTLTADYNWWGNTADNTNDLSGDLAQKWYILDMSVDDAKSIATLSLNNLNDGTTYENYALPSVTLNMQATNGFVRKDEVTLDENGYANVGYLATDAGASITAEYNGVSITREITYDVDSDYSFKALKKLIDQASDNDVITLTHDYDYVIGYDDEYTFTDDAITTGIDIVKKNLTINGNGFIIDAKGKTRIFKVESLASNLTIKNVTFSNGKMSANGGAILWYGDDGNLENCTFINNDAGSYIGGAIYIQGDNLNISNSRFIDNKASKAAGIYVFSENVTIKNSTFTNNGGGSYGGAISVKANNLNIINSTFTGNTVTSQGGALYLESGNDVNIVDSRFINNFASTSGGAIYWVTGKNRNITNSIFANNKVTTSGGAIYFANTISGAETTVYGSTFFNNTATSGGAIYIYSGSLDINKTEFIDNAAQITSNAQAYGGAIYDFSSDKVTIANSNFTGNFAKTSSQSVYAGAIYTANGEIDIANSTFNKNSIDSVSGKYSYGSVIYWKDANGKITNSSFLNNHGKSSSGSAIYITGASSNANVTNSIFINNNYGTTSDTLKVLTRGDGNIEFNECWFGNTKETSGESMGTTTGTGISYKNKLDLYTVHDEYMAVGEDKEIKFVLQYVESGKVIIYDSSKLPKVDLTLSAVNGEIDRNSASMDDAVLFNAYQFGPASITGKFNGIELTENLYAKDIPTITVEEPIVVHVDESVSVNIQKLIPQDASLTFSSIDGDEFIWVASNGYVEGLKEGTSTLYIHYGGNENYVPATVEVPVTVIKYTTSMSCDVDSISVDWGADSQNVTIDFDSGNPDLNPLNPGQYDHFELKCKSNDTNVATVSIVEGKLQINFHSAGTANVTFYFEGNEKYYASEKNITVTVNKVPSSLTISDDVELDYGSSGTTTLTLDGATVDDANIIVENHPEAVIGYENNVVTVSSLDVGTYTLKVTTTPDENHTSVSATANITVTKVDSSVEFESDVEFDYLQSGTTKLINFVGCSVDLVNITVECQTGATIDYNDVTKVITVSGLDAGTYTLKVTTTPDSNHNPVDVTSNITVNKIDSSVTFGDIEFDYLGFGTTTISDYDGCTVDLANIVVVGHPEAVIEFENNVITVSGLGAGTHTLNVTTTPNANYKSKSVLGNIKVNPIASQITLNNTNIVYKYDESNTTKLTLDGCSVDLVNITVDGNNVEGVTYDVETQVITISGLKVGTYELKVVTTPDENHTSVYATASITVEKSNSSVSFSNPVSLFYSEEGATTLTLNGCTVDIINVVDHPEAIIDYDETTHVVTVSGLAVGEYTLKVVTNPDPNHLSVENTTSVSVGKESPKLVMEYSNVTVGENELVFVSMGIAGDVNVTIFKGDEVIDTANVTIGDAGFNKTTFTGLKVGTYIITAYYKGVGRYNDSTLKYKLVIRPIYDYEASAVANDTVYGNTTNVTVTLPEDATGWIVIGDMEKAIESTKTVVELQAQTKLGINSITVKYVPDENSKYAARNFTVLYEVAKVDTAITLTIVNSTTENPVIIAAAIKAEGSVIFDVNGTKYSREITDGRSILELRDVAGGKYNVTAIYEGSEKYNNSSANGSYAVDKVDCDILISVNHESVRTDETATVTVHVDGSGIVTFTVNDADTNVYVSECAAELTFSNLSKGTTIIKARYLGDGKYNPNETEITLTVIPITDYKIEIDVADITVGDDAIVYVFLPAEGKFNITVSNGTAVISQNITSSRYIIPVKLDVGTYNVTVKYYGNEKYDVKVNSTLFSVKPLNVGKLDFNVKVNDTVIGNTTNVTVTLPADAKGTIKIADIVTDIKGFETVIELPEQTKAGMNNITVMYIAAEGSKYSNENVTAFYNVAKKVTEIEIDSITAKAGDTVTVSYTTHSDGDVTVYVDGVKTSQVTDIAAGNHTVVVSVSQTENYTAASTNYTFKVTKNDAVFKLDYQASFRVGDNATVNIDIDDTATGIVVVNVNGTEYSVNISKTKTLKVALNKVGDIALSATYLGDEKYNENKFSGSFKVIPKDDANIEIAGIPSIINAGDTFTVTVSSDNPEIKVYVDGDEKSLGADNKLTVKNIGAGSHDITVVAVETSGYYAGEVVKTFEAVKKAVSIKITEITAKAGDTVTVSYTTESDGDVTVYVDGVKTSSVTDIVAGIHTVVAGVAESDKYLASSANYTFTVSKLDSQIRSVSVNPVVKDSKSKIEVTMNAGQSGYVIIEIGGVNYTAKISGAKASLEVALDRTSSGKVYYLGDDKYNPAALRTFTAVVNDKADSTVTINDVKLEIGKSTTVTGTVNGKSAPIVFTVNGVETSTIAKVEAKTYSVTAVFAGNATHKPGTASKTFKVDKKPSSVKITVEGELTVDKNIRINVESYAGADIAVFMDGKEMANWQAPFKAEAGNHLIVATAAENDEYLSSGDDYTFTVAKKQSQVSVSGTPTVLGKDSLIDVEINSDATGIVIVTVGGKEYSLDVSKTKSLSVSFEKAGVFDISARYLGDDRYMSSESEKNTLVVEDKRSSEILINAPATAYAGDRVEIEVTSTGDGKLEVYFDGIKQTLANDKFTVSNIACGNHLIEAVSPETSGYKYNATSKHINAVKRQSAVMITLPKTVTIGKEVAVEFSSASDAAIIAYIDGVKQTLTDGKVTFTPTAGEHTVAAEVGETDKYLSAYADKKFTVNKFDETISVSVEDITEGQTSTITITTKINEGLAVIKVGEAELAVDLAKSKTANVKLDAAGTYELFVTYLGSDTYNPANASKSTVKVAPKKTADITVDIPEINANESKAISISVPNGRGDVSVIVDGVENKVSLDKNGKATFTLPAMAAGNHDVVVVYPGDDANAAAIASKSFNAPKATSKATISTPSAVKEGENANVNVKIPGATGEVSLIVDGVENKIPLVDGEADCQLNNLSGGEHSVVVIYPGDEANDATYAASSFDAAKKPVIVKKASEFSDITVSDDLRVSFILKDEDGNPIRNTVIKYFDGTDRTTKTDARGMFTVQAKNGVLLTIEYEGTDTIIGTSTAFKLNVPTTPAPAVEKIETHFDIPGGVITLKGYAVDTKAGEEGINYATKLLDSNGNPIEGMKIQFAVNDKIYDRTTNAEGSFTPYKLNMVRAGRYTMAFYTMGNENYTGAFASVCVDLDKKPISIKAPGKVSSSRKYTVSLSTIVGSSHDGKVHLRSGMNVKLTVNGKTLNAKTNAKGKATFKLTGLANGRYSATVSYVGDLTYEAAEKSVIIKV